MLGIQHIFLGCLVMATFHSREEKMLLLVQHVCHHATHQGINESESHEHKSAGEELGEGSRRNDVTVSDGAHCDYTEVESIHEGVRLQSREFLVFPSVDQHSCCKVHHHAYPCLQYYGRSFLEFRLLECFFSSSLPARRVCNCRRRLASVYYPLVGVLGRSRATAGSS